MFRETRSSRAIAKRSCGKGSPWSRRQRDGGGSSAPGQYVGAAMRHHHEVRRSRFRCANQSGSRAHHARPCRAWSRAPARAAPSTSVPTSVSSHLGRPVEPPVLVRAGDPTDDLEAREPLRREGERLRTRRRTCAAITPCTPARPTQCEAISLGWISPAPGRHTASVVLPASTNTRMGSQFPG